MTPAAPARTAQPAALPGGAALRNPGLDAARLSAALMVVICHAVVVIFPLYGWAPPVPVMLAGYFGVELFFVLSGFLIGGLLLDVAATDPTPRGWLVFMVRRWMRTLPLYYLWIGVLFVVEPPHGDLVRHLLAYGTATQNLAWPMPHDEWFNQSWSLTIEEWFYLLFSAALLCAAARAPARTVAWPVIGAFILLPLLGRLLAPPPADFQRDIYHVAVLRLDAIAYGVALAKLRADGSRLFQYGRPAFLLGCAVIASFWIQDSTGLWFRLTPGQYHAVQLTGTSIGFCLILVGMLSWHSRGSMSSRLITAGSEISYGLYIMHLTILEQVLFHAQLNNINQTLAILIAFMLMFAIPYASFRWFEQPILALRPRQRPDRPSQQRGASAANALAQG
jgi:peptidoglycan/LPS O-acetylase OafA/YrhL